MSNEEEMINSEFGDRTKSMVLVTLANIKAEGRGENYGIWDGEYLILDLSPKRLADGRIYFSFLDNIYHPNGGWAIAWRVMNWINSTKLSGEFNVWFYGQLWPRMSSPGALRLLLDKIFDLAYAAGLADEFLATLMFEKEWAQWRTVNNSELLQIEAALFPGKGVDKK